jgi:hypothetical protein
MNRSIVRGGDKFGSWTVLEEIPRNEVTRRTVSCECACGKIKNIALAELTSGRTTQCQSCGNTRHGVSRHQAYNRWLNIKKRCYDKKNPAFINYGALGISVCPEWKNNASVFCAWWDSLSPSDFKEPTIERIDVHGDYCPNNCKIIEKDKQPRNRKSIRGSSSKYIGVSRKRRRFQAQVMHKGKNHYIGVFNSEIKAAKARDRFISTKGWVNYRLNFKTNKNKHTS